MTGFIDCDEASLGTLSPGFFSSRSNKLEQECQARDDSAVINGVELPAHVIWELRKQGIPLSWYNAGELKDAVIACSYDHKLIDDPEGIGFRDKLVETAEERLKKARKAAMRAIYEPEEERQYSWN